MLLVVAAFSIVGQLFWLLGRIDGGPSVFYVSDFLPSLPLLLILLGVGVVAPCTRVAALSGAPGSESLYADEKKYLCRGITCAGIALALVAAGFLVTFALLLPAALTNYYVGPVVMGSFWVVLAVLGAVATALALGAYGYATLTQARGAAALAPCCIQIGGRADEYEAEAPPCCLAPRTRGAKTCDVVVLVSSIGVAVALLFVFLVFCVIAGSGGSVPQPVVTTLLLIGASTLGVAFVAASVLFIPYRSTDVPMSALGYLVSGVCFALMAVLLLVALPLAPGTVFASPLLAFFVIATAIAGCMFIGCVRAPAAVVGV